MSDQEPKVYVNGLSGDVTSDDLRKHFKRFGEITDIFVRNRDTFSFAFVTYEDIEQAREAIDRMNGSNKLGGRMNCAFAKPRRSGGGGGGQGGGRSRACFKCGEEGHFARECPNGDGGGSSNYRGRRSNSLRRTSTSPRRKASVSRSGSGSVRARKHSVSRSGSRSPVKGRKHSVSRSGSPAFAKRKHSVSRSGSPPSRKGRSRSRSVERHQIRENVRRRRSPSSHSRSN